MATVTDWTCVDAARGYAEHGWRVLPLHSVHDGRCSCGNRGCKTPGKHPRTAHGVHDASDDQDQIGAWWVDWPDANVGIATGSVSGLVVVDVDPRNGGMESLGKLAGDLPDTYTVQTGGGGLHLYYGCRDRLKQRLLAPGIDLKADGGYVVAPPSNHLAGAYSVASNADCQPLPVAIRMVGPSESPEANGNGTVIGPDQKQWVVSLLTTTCPKGQRNQTLTRLAGYFRNVLPEAVTLSVLIEWNAQYCEPPLTAAEVRSCVHQKYTRYAGDDLQPMQVWTSRTLLAASLPPPVWIVEGLLPEGLTFLAGRPKRGKSWLALQAAVDVTTARSTLGPTTTGRVLYLALEDSPRRLQSRLQQMRAEPSDDLLFLTSLAPFDNGGLAELTDMIETHRPVLVVIDTLARTMSRGRDSDSVADMTDLLAPLQALALRLHLSILLVDHHRKPGPDVADMIDDILGSTAKTAVADAILGLYRKSGEAYAMLKITGRDVEEQEIALAWDGVHFQWRITEPRDDQQMLQRRISVKKLLSQVEEIDVTLAASELGVSIPTARQILDHMNEIGILRRDWIPTSTRGKPKAIYRLATSEGEKK